MLLLELDAERFGTVHPEHSSRLQENTAAVFIHVENFGGAFFVIDAGRNAIFFSTYSYSDHNCKREWISLKQEVGRRFCDSFPKMNFSFMGRKMS